MIGTVESPVNPTRRKGLSIALAISIVLILFLAMSSNAMAFGELNNLQMDFSPSSARPSSNAHISITIFNHNSRSLAVTSVDLQIYGGVSFSDISTHYHVFSGNQTIPSEGSHEFGLDAKMPNYMGDCDLSVIVGGSLEGDSNLSFGLMTSSIFLDPTIAPSLSDLLPFIILGAIAVVVVIAVVIYLSRRL